MAAPPIATRALLELVRDPSAAVDADGVVVHANAACERLLGFTAGDLAGPALERVLAAGERLGDGPRRLRTPTGDRRFALRLAREDGLLLVHATDLAALDALEAAARRDPLTGLANRAQLGDRLDHALARRPAPGRSCVVAFIDVDGLKAVNDLHGHEAGDELLCAVAAALERVARPADTVARLGGDEFVVLLEDADREVAARLGERIAATIGEVRLPGLPPASASVGVVVAEPGSTAEEVLRDADIAMYQAKAAGGDGWLAYDDALRDATRRRLRTAAALRTAVRDDALDVAFQPIVDVPGRRRLGFEALLRWPGTDLEPQAFVALAEADGTIVELGAWALDRACAQAAAWRREGLLGSMSVNVAPRQLVHPSFGATVEAALRRHALPGTALCVEVTETTLLEAGTASAVLGRLRAGGVHIALDDFGKGFSSLSHLKAFPVDIVKIDRSFVADVADDADDRALVQAVTSLGRVLGMTVVAEGVETERQAAALLRLGCEVHQGFRYGRPVPGPEHDLRTAPPGARREVGDPFVIREFMRQVGLPARIAR